MTLRGIIKTKEKDAGKKKQEKKKVKRDVQLHAYMICADRLEEALDGMKC